MSTIASMIYRPLPDALPNEIDFLKRLTKKIYLFSRDTNQILLEQFAQKYKIFAIKSKCMDGRVDGEGQTDSQLFPVGGIARYFRTLGGLPDFKHEGTVRKFLRWQRQAEALNKEILVILSAHTSLKEETHLGCAGNGYNFSDNISRLRERSNFLNKTFAPTIIIGNNTDTGELFLINPENNQYLYSQELSLINYEKNHRSIGSFLHKNVSWTQVEFLARFLEANKSFIEKGLYKKKLIEHREYGIVYGSFFRTVPPSVVFKVTNIAPNAIQAVEIAINLVVKNIAENRINQQDGLVFSMVSQYSKTEKDFLALSAHNNFLDYMKLIQNSLPVELQQFARYYNFRVNEDTWQTELLNRYVPEQAYATG